MGRSRRCSCRRRAALHQQVTVGAPLAGTGHQVVVLGGVGSWRWRREAEQGAVLQVLVGHCRGMGARGGVNSVFFSHKLTQIRLFLQPVESPPYLPLERLQLKATSALALLYFTRSAVTNHARHARHILISFHGCETCDTSRDRTTKNKYKNRKGCEKDSTKEKSALLHRFEDLCLRACPGARGF